MISLILLSACASNPTHTCTPCEIPHRGGDTIRDGLAWGLDLEQALKDCNTQNGNEAFNE